MWCLGALGIRRDAPISNGIFHGIMGNVDMGRSFTCGSIFYIISVSEKSQINAKYVDKFYWIFYDYQIFTREPKMAFEKRAN